jgi:serine/threonine protein kinase
MQVKAAPGRYKPRCARCHKAFDLNVGRGPDAGDSVIASAIDDRDPVSGDIARALGIEVEHTATVSHSSTPAVAPTAPPRTSRPRRDAPPVAEQPQQTQPPPTESSPLRLREASAPAATAPPRSPAADAPRAADEEDVPQLLGGYRIMQKIGAGGMGAVYLAQQLSLDRSVAVKVMHPQWARDAQFVARFTREAYAAAQLVHHNVVQIHDIGAEHDTHYFSMEFVRGQTLSDLVARDGRLDPEAAAGYVLQAARALKFAHDHGMIHRDVKPDNLMLNDLGLVKVADLGLVKTPGAAGWTRTASPARRAPADVTQAHVSMGTPAYMSPEQAEDAASVDGRADVYSLGCTLYFLLTGRPPFQGATAEEVIRKHASTAITPPEQLAPRVPPALSAIVMKMTARRREDRYDTMTDAIEDLERFLDLDRAVRFSPREEHVLALQRHVEQFNAAPGARLRPKLLGAFFGLSATAAVAAALQGAEPWLMGALVGLPVLAVVMHVLLSGVLRKTYFFTRYRQLLVAGRLGDWIKWFVVLGLIVVGLALSGGLVAWLLVLLASSLLAAAMVALIDRPLDRRRAPILAQAEQLLRGLRLRGLDEDSLRRFVCRYAGDSWEEFFEALFGYEAKMRARLHWGRNERGQARPRFAAWRDPIIQWIDQKIAQRDEDRQRRHLQRVEARRLEASGADVIEARRRAKRIADEMVDRALAFRRKAQPADQPQPRSAAHSDIIELRRPLFEGVDDERALGYRRQSYLRRRVGGPLDVVFGPQVRFIAGVVIFGVFLLWLYQNRDYAVEEAKVLAGTRVDPAAIAGKTDKAIVTRRDYQSADLVRRTVDLPLVPDWIDDLLSSWNAGVAGALLIFSALFRGRVMGFLVLVGALVLLTGPILPVGSVAGLGPERVALIGGVGLILLAILLARETE